MFWGLIMEPNKRYTQVVEKPFHISQAALDTSTGDNDLCQVMVVVDGKNFLVCTLQKTKGIQVPLDLYFKTGNSIAFLTNGNCNVHLTGYLDPDFEEEGSDDDEEESDDEVPELVPIKNKRKLEDKNDATANKKIKKDKKETKKSPAAESSDDEDDDEEDDSLQKLLDGDDLETDENDESFKVNTSGDASEEDEDDSDEEEEEGDEEDNEAESSEEAETTLDVSKEDTKVDITKLTKSQKKRLKKKQKQAMVKDEPKVNGVEKGKKVKPEPQQKADKKKAKEDGKKEVPDAQAIEKKEKKSLSGGVQIEDLKVGTGPVAKPGKVVMVYYEGRLKQNNKMFDNCAKGPGFKFRLGAKEVISGWDIGVAGMKVGGKRKIICPPAMAYGAKGSPPVIPPNSTLMFEVELKNVK